MKRWPVIRYIRWAWHYYWFCHWWYQVGSKFWLHPNPADFDYLDRIRHGQA